MKIKRVFSEGLYSYQQMDFHFDQYPGSTTLILGKSLDDKTSNGSGKTTIMKTMYFALYGEDVYGATKGSIVQRGSGKGWYVKTEFEDRGHEYAIERFEGRKDKSSTGKGLNFYIDGQLFNGEGPDATQKIIQQKIKITPRLFLSSVYSMQDADTNFLKQSDTNKKELLSELLDLQVYAKAFAHVKDEIKTIEEKQKDKENKIENLQEQIATLSEQSKQLTEKRTAFDAEAANEMNAEKQKLQEIIARIKTLESPVTTKNLAKIVSKIQSVKDNKLSLEKKLSEETKVQNTLAKINAELSQTERFYSDSNSSVKKYEKLIIELDKSTFDGEEKTQAVAQKQQMEDELHTAEKSKEKANALTLELNNIKNTINNLKKDVIKLDQQIKTLTESETCPTCHRAYEEEHLNHVKEEINKLINQKNTVEQEISVVSQQMNVKQAELELLKEDVAQMDFLKSAMATIEKSIFSLTLQEQKFELKEQEKARHEQSIKDLLKGIEERKTKNIRFEEGKIKMEGMLESFIPLKQQLSDLEKNLYELNAEQIQAEVEKSRVEQLIASQEEIRSQEGKIRDNITKLKERTNPFGEMISSIDKKMVSFYDKIDQHKENLLKDQEELKYFNFWQIGFAPTGIRSFITDDVIDLLNRKVQDNLNDLFNGALSVVFDPESKNKKGVVSNKISTNIFHNGKETSFELLSGGEKRRAILATNLALTEVAESRSGTKLNVCFLDEPLDGIDSHGQLQAFRLFSRLSKDKDGFFVISHDENFQNMCSNVVYVIKKNEVSRIVSKKEFDDAEILGDNLRMSAASSTILQDSELSKKEILAEKLRELSRKK